MQLKTKQKSWQKAVPTHLTYKDLFLVRVKSWQNNVQIKNLILMRR